MSYVYRIVKRRPGYAEGTEMHRGTVETLSELMGNLPVIVIKRSDKPHCTHVYEAQVWSAVTGTWMCYMPLEVWNAAPARVSLSSLIFATDIPLVTPDAPSLTFRDIRLTGMDVPPLPAYITPAVTHI